MEVLTHKQKLDRNYLFSYPETKNILQSVDNKKLADYFLAEDGFDYGLDFNGLNYLEAAKMLGSGEYLEEWLQHVLIALHPDKYETMFSVAYH